MSVILGEIAVLTTTIIAQSEIAENQLVGFDGNPTADDGIVYGAARSDAKPGEAVTLTLIGLRDLIAPAAIARGALVASDAEGNPKTTADPATAFGRCVKAAVNPGDRCTILMK